MRKCFLLPLTLCLLMTGCGTRETAADPAASTAVTVSPTPAISETAAPAIESPAVPLPDPENDPTGYLLACLDWAMEGERVSIRFWQHPGSGPSPEYLSVADYGQALRELFSAFDWQVTQCPSYDEEGGENAPFNQPGAYSASIYYGDPWAGYISLGTGDPVIMLGLNGPDSVYLRADGAEELCDKLADLTPSVYINLGRTRVPAQESPEATLELYLKTALEQTKQLGHISDYTIDAYEIIPSNDPADQKIGWPEHPGVAYTVTYSIQPAHPEQDTWQRVLRKDGKEGGWLENTIDWEFIAYDARDGLYGMY